MKIHIGSLRPGQTTPAPGTVELQRGPWVVHMDIEHADQQFLINTEVRCRIDPADLSLHIEALTFMNVAHKNLPPEDVVPRQIPADTLERLDLPDGSIGVVAGYDVDNWLVPHPESETFDARVDFWELGIHGVAGVHENSTAFYVWSIGEQSEAAEVLMGDAAQQMRLSLKNSKKAQGDRKASPEAIEAFRARWLAEKHGRTRGLQKAIQLEFGIKDVRTINRKRIKTE